jgi:nicotinamidase-related amidase
MDKNYEFISVINSILLLVDYQPRKLNSIKSGDRLEIMNAVTSAAKAACILNVPVVMTSVHDSTGGEGEFIKSLSGILPEREVITRSANDMNALNDMVLWKKVRSYSRDKIIVAGIWTSESLAETATGAIGKGYDVFCLIDAAGDTSPERHNNGLRRMRSAGVTPITWMSLASEWMNGWSLTAESDSYGEFPGKYNAMLSYLARD